MSDKKQPPAKPAQPPAKPESPPTEQMAATTPDEPTPEQQAEAKAVLQRRKRIAILQSLAASLGEAVRVLEKPLKFKCWLVVVRADGPPEVEEFADIDGLGKRIIELRVEQRAQPEQAIFVHAFRGSYLPIQKGRRWTILDGGELISIEGDMQPHVDTHGSLLETLSLDDVEAKETPIPAQPEGAVPVPPEPAPPEPVPPEPVSPAGPAPLTMLGAPELPVQPASPPQQLDVTQPPPGPQ